jgi:hypothetical protein
MKQHLNAEAQMINVLNSGWLPAALIGVCYDG